MTTTFRESQPFLIPPESNPHKLVKKKTVHVGIENIELLNWVLKTIDVTSNYSIIQGRIGTLANVSLRIVDLEYFESTLDQFYYSAILNSRQDCAVDYSSEIQPILSTNCTSCHGVSGGLALTSYSDLMGNDVVDPGNSMTSKLIQKLRGTASGSQMPKNQDPLDEATINLIETWIDEGALDN